MKNETIKVSGEVFMKNRLCSWLDVVLKVLDIAGSCFVMTFILLGAFLIGLIPAILFCLWLF